MTRRRWNPEDRLAPWRNDIRERGAGYFELADEVAVYVPSTFGESSQVEISQEAFSQRIEDVADWMSRTFGGTTRYEPVTTEGGIVGTYTPTEWRKWTKAAQDALIEKGCRLDDVDLEERKDGIYYKHHFDLIPEQVARVMSFSGDFSPKVRRRLIDQCVRWCFEWRQYAVGVEFEGDMIYIERPLLTPELQKVLDLLDSSRLPKAKRDEIEKLLQKASLC